MDNFDWVYYLNYNLDVKESGFNTKESAYIHWIEYGEKEGRPHKFLNSNLERYIMNIQSLIYNNHISIEDSWDLLIRIINESDDKKYDNFDWKYYLSENDDLFEVKLSTEDEALEHLNKIGKYDNNFKYSKDYFILEKITKNNFDWVYYITTNIDLIKNNIVSYDKAWEHWTNYGKYENRSYKCLFNQNITYESFDWEFYLENNQDLRNLTQEGAWQHWIYYGRNENRKIKLYDNEEIMNNITTNINNEEIINNITNNEEIINNITNNEEIINSKEIISNIEQNYTNINNKKILTNKDKNKRILESIFYKDYNKFKDNKLNSNIELSNSILNDNNIDKYNIEYYIKLNNS